MPGYVNVNVLLELIVRENLWPLHVSFLLYVYKSVLCVCVCFCLCVSECLYESIHIYFQACIFLSFSLFLLLECGVVCVCVCEFVGYV